MHHKQMTNRMVIPILVAAVPFAGCLNLNVPERPDENDGECGDLPTGIEDWGQGCQTDQECPGDTTCVIPDGRTNGYCAPSCCRNGEPSPAYCTDISDGNEQCGTLLMTDDASPEPPYHCIVECAETAECPHDMVCERDEAGDGLCMPCSAGDGVGYDWATACNTTADCGDDTTCVRFGSTTMGFCSPECCDLGGIDRERCTNISSGDELCDVGYRHNDGQTLEPPYNCAIYCEDDTECPNDLLCSSDGVCNHHCLEAISDVEGWGTACEEDEDCPENTECTKIREWDYGYCSPQCCEINEEDPSYCTDISEGLEVCNVSISGNPPFACVIYCEDHSQCPHDLVCLSGDSSQANACGPPCEAVVPGLEWGTACASDDDCAPNTSCVVLPGRTAGHCAPTCCVPGEPDAEVCSDVGNGTEICSEDPTLDDVSPRPPYHCLVQCAGDTDCPAELQCVIPDGEATGICSGPE